MINFRGAPKKKYAKPEKVLTNISTLEISSPTPPESERSLLIHDDKYDILSNTSLSGEIRDKDIPAEKRSIINDNSYFKQLSLSFYGEAQSPKQTVVKKETERSRVKKESSSKLNSSLSPRSDYNFYYGLKKPLHLQFEKDPFQLGYSTLIKTSQKSQNSLKSSKANISQSKEKSIDRYESASPQSIGRIELKDLKMFKVNTNKVLESARAKNSSRGMYPQFTTGQTTSATTPRHKNSWDTNLVKEVRRSNIKKVAANTKARIVNKEYMLSGPNNSLLKSPNNSHNTSGFANKLKGYGPDSPSIINFKVVMGADGRIQSNKAVLHERTSPSPASSRGFQGIQGVAVKRKMVTNTSKLYKNSGYYE